MHVSVSGKQVDVGDSLREYIENRLQDSMPKYLDRVNNVNVVVSRESHMFRVDINGNTGTHSGITIKSRAEGNDVYATFDQAAERVEKQLRRYKRRITNHHKQRPVADESKVTDLRAVKARKYVLAREEEDRELEEAAPAIIAEKPTDVETLTVSEAVMKMDLADLPALMFFNSGNGRLNVVYRRVDGNISWVDPEL